MLVSSSVLYAIALVLLIVLLLAVSLFLVRPASPLMRRLPAHSRGRQLVRLTIPAVTVSIALLLAHAWGNPFQPGWRSSAPDKTAVASSDLYRTIPLGQANVAIGGGGYVTGIYLHPRERDLVYIRTDIGGFYRWLPREQRWLPLTDHFSVDESNYFGGEALALDPQHPNVVYIAAGKYHHAGNGGLFKSSDRGQTWRKLPLELPMGGNEQLRWVGERLVVSPTDSRLLLFGSRRDGLWRSTNGGNSWTRIPSIPQTAQEEDHVGICSIAFHPRQPGMVYASLYGDGVYQSRDGGQTWRRLEGSPSQVHRLAIAPSGIVYGTAKGPDGIVRFNRDRWTVISPPGSTESFNGLTINPRNPSEILVSEDQEEQARLYFSANGGDTWTLLRASITQTVPWWPEKYFANHIADLAFDPLVAGRVWFTDWYGIWRTERIAANPVRWTNYVYNHEQVVTFTLVSPPQGAALLSGLADVDGFKHDRGLTTFPSRNFASSGPKFQDTYDLSYCEANPLHLVRVGGNRWNQTYNGAISKDGGSSWQPFSSFPTDKMPLRVAISATDCDRFIVLLSDYPPMLTSNGGRSWQPISGLPNGMDGPWTWNRPLVADPVESDRFYYYDDGTVYRSEDRGTRFAKVNTNLPDSSWYALHTSPGQRGELWLAANEDGLYRSSDGGTTFTRVARVKQARLFSTGMPATGSRNPALYLYGQVEGGAEGIFQSLDNGTTWLPISHPQRPMGNVPNSMEASQQQFGLVFVGTNGRGIYFGSSEATRR